MEASKRERIVLYGVVPVLAAVVGAIATVIATKYFGTSSTEDALRTLVADPKITTDERLKLLAAIKALDEPFWSVVRLAMGALMVPVTWIGCQYALSINKR